MSMIRLFYRAIRYPQPAPSKASWRRRIFRVPVIFDITSFLLQFRNRKRRRAAGDRFQSEDGYFQAVQSYNAGRTTKSKITKTRRAEVVYQIATMPRTCVPNDEKLLIIGPRDVHELFIAWCYGYRWENMTGIDLYSVDPRILVMNMEEMTFDDATFDCITMAMTLAYAKNTRKCLEECARVLKPGGRFVFVATYCPDATEWHGNSVPGNEIASVLMELGLEPYYSDSQDKKNKLDLQQTSHLLGFMKPEPNKPGFDRIAWGNLRQREPVNG